jgi:hypothetical protein
MVRLDDRTLPFSFCSNARERRIPEDTADYARWLADRIEERGERTPLRLNPATSMFVGMALRGYARLLDGREAAEMAFTVSDAIGARVELVAACKAPEVAWAAFHLAIASRPRQVIVLRHGSRIVAQHGGGAETATIEGPAGNASASEAS